MLTTAPSNIFANEVTAMPQDGSAWLDRFSIPDSLQSHSHELEALLNKVFKNCPVTDQNIELAKQLAINWCTSKCKELDIPAEANIAELTR